MSTQPLVELQINASAFLAAQLLALQAQKLAFPTPIQIGDIQLVVDHVEFGANRLDHSVVTEEFIYHVVRFPDKVFDRVEGRKVLIVQPITVFVASLADIMAHPNQAPSQLFPLQATIFVRLFYSNDDIYQDRFQTAFDHIDIGPLPPLPPGVDGNALTQQFQTFAAKLVPSTSVTLGLAGKATGANAAVSIINTGISVDTDLTRIALRQELGIGSELDPAIWQTFFLGDVPDHLQGAGYAVFLASSVVENIFEQQISTGLGASHDNRFELVSGVGCTYSNPSGVARLNATFSGNVNAPICTVWTDVSVGGTMSIDAPNVITVDVNLSFNPETTACTVTAAFLGAAIGLIADFVVPLGSLIVDPILGAMGGIATVVYLAGTTGPGKLPVPDCNQESDTQLVCTRTVPVITTPLGKLNLQSMAGLDDGIILQGALLAIPVGAPRMTIKSDVQFALIPPVISCGGLSGNEGKDFDKNPKAFVHIDAGITITAGSLAPIYLLDTHVVNDPLGVFSNSLTIAGSQAPISIGISSGYPSDAYFQAPYPCQVLISTTGGERLVSIQPPPQLTQQDIDRMSAQLNAQIGNCQKLVNNWFEGGIFNPQWLIDPGPGDRIVDHYYEVAVDGLGNGELANLVDAGNQVLVSGVAVANQSLRMSTVLAPTIGNEIGLLRVSQTQDVAGAIGHLVHSVASATKHDKTARGIGVTERLIVRTATITLPAPAHRIAAAYLGGVPCVLSISGDRLTAFDLSNPALPSSLMSLSVPGLSGVIAHGGGLAAFGEAGFFLVDMQGARPATCGCMGETAVLGAAPGTGVLYAITDSGLEVFSPRFTQLQTISLEGSGPLARAGDKLVAASAKGLEVFSIVNPKHPDRKEGFELSGIVDLVKPFGDVGQALLAVAEPGPSKLFDFSRGDDPKPVADYPQPPWYVGTARIGNLLLKLDKGGAAIQVSFFAKSRLL